MTTDVATGLSRATARLAASRCPAASCTPPAAAGPGTASAVTVRKRQSRKLTAAGRFSCAMGRNTSGNASIMPSARAAEALDARGAALTGETQRLQETLDATDAPEVHMIEVHYLLARLRHDREWLTATAARIRAGDLTWP
jgi:hypothetical protein